MKEINILREDFARCPECGSSLLPSRVPGYKYSCNECDEDFYEFEVTKNRATKNGPEYEWTIEFAWLPKRTFENKLFWLLPYVDIMTKDGTELIDTLKKRDGRVVAKSAVEKLYDTKQKIENKKIMIDASNNIKRLIEDREDWYEDGNFDYPFDIEEGIRDSAEQLATLVLEDVKNDI